MVYQPLVGILQQEDTHFEIGDLVGTSGGFGGVGYLRYHASEGRVWVGIHAYDSGVAQVHIHYVAFAHINPGLHAVEVGQSEYLGPGHLGSTHHPFAQFYREERDGAVARGVYGGFPEILGGLLKGSP